MAATPPPFDKEKAKRAWFSLLKGVLVMGVIFAAVYYVFERVENRADTPLEAAVKAGDVSAVRDALGTPNSPEAAEAALFVYRLALETLSSSSPATIEVLRLILTQEPSSIAQRHTTKWADHQFTTPRSRSREGSVLTAVELAARRRSADGVRVLIKHGLTIPSIGATSALVTAASNGSEDVIAVLLDAGVDVQGRDRHNDTALAMARRVNNPAMVDLLLARGARE